MKTWKVREFAEVCGVTVKALYHYDRIGLLKAGRTPSGYRVYSERDLEKLEQISALRFLGMSLRQVEAVLNGLQADPREMLLLQRRALEEKRRQIGLAIEAIGEAERAMGPEVLGRLIMAVEAQKVDLGAYFSPEALAELRAFYETGRSAEWSELQRDVLAVVGEDPAGPAGRALAVRFQDFMKRRGGAFPQFSGPGPNAPQLPGALVRQFEKSNVAKVVPFLMRASAALGEG